jgi:hypothetical protein
VRGESFDFDQPNVGAALTYRRPLGNRSAEAELLRLEQERLGVEAAADETALRLETTVRSLAAQLAAMDEVLDLGAEQIRLAEEKTAEELRLYEQGRNELNFVIQSRDAQAMVRLLHARNAAQYQQAWWSLLSVTDELLDRVAAP